ncbi:glycosyltransferase family 2 protein [Kordia jejudonensis]|uniref:glycosyltransferase family 2 protein n=1 Tax=Kordia jejudonensis TaxID=1348245 RepID=UPI000629BF5C|nr:glycosyltransferase [Kordia jejudonensis]
MIDILLCCSIAIYIVMIGCFIVGFWKQPTIKQQEHINPVVDFSVIIPFRNEASNLPALLESITQIQYPTTKVSYWFIDDDSEDDSSEIIERFQQEHPEINISVLKNKRVSSSPKKDAIRTAIRQIKSNWIITTDADCILPTNWLQLFNQEIFLKRPRMIAAPVSYKNTASFFSYFQLLDFLSLQGTTIGSFGLKAPFMCNGANLAYQKEAFLEVQGFAGNDTIASGDDVFLLEKFIKKWPNRIHYLKSRAVVIYTFPVATFSELISQRMRWASKSAKYSLARGKLVGAVVMLMNILICLLPLLLLFTSVSWQLIVLILVLKFLVDSLLLAQTFRFTGQKIRFLYFIISAFLYPFFTVFVFLSSLFTSYTWKNRAFKM